MSNILELNCWVLGDDPRRVFSVEIVISKTVSALKKLIKDEKKHTFDGIDADLLDLWKVNFDLANFDLSVVDEEYLNNPKVNNGTHGVRILHAWQRLSKVITDVPEDEHLHVIVQRPLECPTAKLKPSSSSHKLDSISKGRDQWTKIFPSKAPSDQGKPKQFASDQKKTPPAFYFNRPPSTAATIPITLYHPVFGQFQDGCDTYIPTKDDHDFVLKFSLSMSDFYDNEDLRAEQARKDMETYGLCFGATRISKYTTDGDMRWNGFCYGLIEFKGEIGSTGAEPLFQAGWYYTAFMRDKLRTHANSNLPCFILYLAGAHIGFAGAVWTDRPHLQVLSPTLPLFYHATDVNMRMRAARYFGAAKEAIFALERFYKQELDAINALDPDKRPKPAFPHPDHYIPLSDSTTHAFRYVSPLYNDKLIFHGKTADENVCVKFTRRYSKDAHLTCSTLGFAPPLRGYQLIPGGWIMVVMDFIDDSYQELDDMPQTVKAAFYTEVREKIVSLHQAGYVHGDVRATNILAKKNGAPGILLIDFDWAGVIGNVRYPMNVNRDGIDRPDGAYDGELITAEHDMNMVDYIFA